jgi:glycosyltransferase involved in cell wall biosynthesis
LIKYGTLKLLFVLHELSRTGSPLVMLNFIKWLKDNTSYHLTIFALKSGELHKDFELLADQLIILPVVSPKTFTERLLSRILPSKTVLEKFYDQLSKLSIDLIYANSVPTFKSAQELSETTGAKLLCHLHEGKTMLKLIDRSWLKKKHLIDEFIVPSKLVASDLNKIANFKNVPIHIVRETPANVVKQNTIEKDFFIVGGSGTVHWRKGPELFLQVAVHFFKKKPNALVKFQWLGSIDDETRIVFEDDIEKAQLKGKIEFMGATKDAIEVFKSFSVFLLTSREDPYPLVCIENGLLGNPIITFEGATGINETIDQGGGVIVPYLDTVAMSDAVDLCYNDRGFLMEMSVQVQELFKTSNFNVVFPALNNIIKKYGE